MPFSPSTQELRDSIEDLLKNKLFSESNDFKKEIIFLMTLWKQTHSSFPGMCFGLEQFNSAMLSMNELLKAIVSGNIETATKSYSDLNRFCRTSDLVSSYCTLGGLLMGVMVGIAIMGVAAALLTNPVAWIAIGTSAMLILPYIGVMIGQFFDDSPAQDSSNRIGLQINSFFGRQSKISTDDASKHAHATEAPTAPMVF